MQQKVIVTYFFTFVHLYLFFSLFDFEHVCFLISVVCVYLCFLSTVYIFKVLVVVKTELNYCWQVCYGIMMDLHDDWWQLDSLISVY